MKTYLDCVVCFARQALDAARLTTDDPAVHERVLRETFRLVPELDFASPPPLMSQRIHRLLKSAVGDEDPYRRVKRMSNELALRLYPRLKAEVDKSDDPFAAAVGFAIAGNIIDFGCKSRVTEADVYEAIEQAVSTRLDGHAVGALKAAIAGAKDILYLADNAGEIILDRLLIEQMPLDRVTVVVKGQPIINDATREDAEAAGLTSIVSVIDQGADIPGTILELCSSSFQKRFADCDLVISKGQGNYETLSDQRKVFFLLKAKCPVVARDIGCDVGSMVIWRRGAG